MFIDIRKTAEGHSSAEVMLSFPEDLQYAGKVVGEFPATVTVSRYDKYIFVKVVYKGQVECECGRCLISFIRDVSGKVEFTIQSAEVEDMGSDDVDTYVFETEDDKLDFSQTVYDDMMTRVPVQPVCSTSCPGFVNTAEAPQEDEAEIEETPIDPRWAALGQLKK